MPSIEEIKAFAEAEGFEARTCGHFGRPMINTDCRLCGGMGKYFFMHDTAWPPAAIEMMMADRAKYTTLAAAAQDLAVKLSKTSMAALQVLELLDTGEYIPAQGARIE